MKGMKVSRNTIFNNKGGDPPSKCWGFATTDFHPFYMDLARPFVDGEVWSLYIHGSNGTGKSCFAAAILQYWRLKHEGLVGAWIDCDVLENAMMLFDTWQSRRRAEIRRDFLVLDDLGSKPAKQESRYKPGEWHGIIRARQRKNLPTLITTNKNLFQLQSYIDSSITSRLQEGVIMEMNGKDLRGEKT